jgi:hypothetical protein
MLEERERRRTFCSGEERGDLFKYSEEQSECPSTDPAYLIHSPYSM